MRSPCVLGGIVFDGEQFEPSQHNSDVLGIRLDRQHLDSRYDHVLGVQWAKLFDHIDLVAVSHLEEE